MEDIILANCGARQIELYDPSLDESIFIHENTAILEQWLQCFREVKEKASLDEKSEEVVFKNMLSSKCFSCKQPSFYDELLSLDWKGGEDDVTDLHLKQCKTCVRSNVREWISLRENDEKSSSDYSIRDLRHILSKQEFNNFVEISLNNLLKREPFVSCPKCKETREFVSNDLTDASDLNKVYCIDGKELDEKGKAHYLSSRLKCRNVNCSISWCRQCKVTPYHLGFDCAEYKVYSTADHCRFCKVALVPKRQCTTWPSETLRFVCNGTECLQKRSQACVEELSCGHACIGVRDELNCPPCPTCLDCLQKPDEICNICYTEELGSAPSVMLDCGHIFHYHCVKKRITGGWPSPHITFGFLECPLCNMRITAPMLDTPMRPLRKLYRDLEHRSWKQLTKDISLYKEDMKHEMPDFYENPVGLA